jgi:hypothetical protein
MRALKKVEELKQNRNVYTRIEKRVELCRPTVQ